MSLQSANEFVSATISSHKLMAKVAEVVAGKSPTDAAHAVSDLGKLNGFEFTAQEATQARQAVLQSQRLSEDDLDGIAGGTGLQSQPGEKATGGGFVSPGSIGGFPSNETKPAPTLGGGTGTITDVAAAW
jgi:hypothetical protein